MNKELQDKAWAVLPKEFREEVRRQYHIAIDSEQHYTLCTLEYLFGGHLHSLTSDTETEEMLIISRKAAEEFYNKYLGDALQAVSRITLRKDINTLFGGKCRVGEDDIVVNKTEPKFKVGDMVKYRLDGKRYEVMGKTGKYHYSLNGYDKDVLESDLEPYTEPEKKNHFEQDLEMVTQIDWEQRRYELSKELMKGLATNSNEEIVGQSIDSLVTCSVCGADKLIKELRKGNKE